MSLSHDLQMEGNPLVTERTADKIRKAVRKLEEELIIRYDTKERITELTNEIFGEGLI